MPKALTVRSLRMASQAACLALAGLMLAGCVVYPAYGPHYRPYSYYR